MRLRIGVVGAGRRGRAHVATIVELPEFFELAGICDVNAASARALARRLGCDAYSDVDEFLSRKSLDAVLIATPPASHPLVAEAAADHRVHMLIETPLAPTRAMMDSIAAAAAKAGVQVEVGENYGRRPAERLNRMAVEAGLIGEVVHLSAYNAPANHESCYHMMSLFQLYAGADVEEVSAWATHCELGAANAGGPAEETWVDAFLTFTNGIKASCGYVTTRTAPHRWGRPGITAIEGTHGYIVSEDGGVSRLHQVENGTAADRPMKLAARREKERDIPERFFYETKPPIEFLNPFADRVMTDVEKNGVADGLARAAELMSLYRAVTEGVEPEFGIARARRTQELGIAIIESARIGRPLKAKLAEDTSWERKQHELLRWP
jgi:predicted dehydrogenase